MRLLANENFPLTSVKILEKAGYDIIYAGLDFKGIVDAFVMDPTSWKVLSQFSLALIFLLFSFI
jgi:hypothetical protein